MRVCPESIPINFSESGFMFTWSAGDFSLISVFLTEEFVHKLFLNRCVCREKQSSGLFLHHLANVTTYIISFYDMLTSLMVSLVLEIHWTTFFVII